MNPSEDQFPVNPDADFEQFQIGCSLQSLFNVLNPNSILLLGPAIPLEAHAFAPAEVTQLNITSMGETLDFGDAAFSCVVLHDVLEQLNDNARSDLLLESSRVSRDSLVVISAFDSPILRKAEESVEEISRTSRGNEDPRVVLHRDVRLPTLATCASWMEQLHSARPVVLPLGSIRSWSLFRMMGHAAHAFERGEVFYHSLSSFYNKQLAARDHGYPCYRHMVVSGAEIPARELEALRQNLSEGSCGPEIELLRGMLHLMLDGIADALAVKPVDESWHKLPGYTRELERKIRSQERRIEKLTNELEHAKKSGNSKSPARLIKKLFNI